MADTKTKSKAKTSKAQSKKPSSGSASKAKSKAKAKTTKATKNGAQKNGAQASSKNGAQSSSNGSTPVLEKAKIPLLAGGAAVAGVAGAVIAATHSGGKRKVLGVSVPKRSKLHLPKKNGLKSDAHKVAGAVADAAKRADTFGQGVSRIASSVKQVSESADDAVKKV
jgi:hypothetical protein